MPSADPRPDLDYCHAVLSGEIVTGELVRLACKRHLDDLDRSTKQGSKIRFEPELGQRVLRFLALCHHYKGRWAVRRVGCTCAHDFDNCPSRFKPSLWQAAAVMMIFGWLKRRDDIGRWLRLFRVVCILVSRKNGKSFLAACIALYMLKADGEPSAEIYAAATKRDQARYVHDIAKGIVRASPALRGRISGYQHRLGNLYIPEDDSKFEPLSADANTLDALGPHMAILDELHAHPTEDVRNVLESGMGAREQPILFEISTAGELRDNSICKAERDYGEAVLRGESTGEAADAFFALIFEPDQGDEWSEPLAWRKANPNLGVSVLESEIAEKCDAALSSPIHRYEFQTKRCNLWVDVAMGLFDMEAWRSCPKSIDLEALRGRVCYGGIDLAEKSDMTAFALVFPPDRPDGAWTARLWYWMPAQRLVGRTAEARLLAGWHETGHLDAAGEQLLDTEIVARTIRETAGVYEIAEIGFDPWKARQFALELQNEGMVVVELPQGHKTLGAATTMLVDLVKARRFSCEAHPILTWNAAGTVGRLDSNKNVIPDKRKSSRRIDGISAVVNALSRAIAAIQQPSIYEPGTEPTGPRSVYEPA